jgi:hypothetical protein
MAAERAAGLESEAAMTKTFFVACGFEIEGSTITFGTPSVAHRSLVSQLRPGNGVHIVTALESPTGHATDNGNFDVHFNSKTRELDWCMRSANWQAHVIVQEPLTTALLAELRNL